MGSGGERSFQELEIAMGGPRAPPRGPTVRGAPGPPVDMQGSPPLLGHHRVGAARPEGERDRPVLRHVQLLFQSADAAVAHLHVRLAGLRSRRVRLSLRLALGIAVPAGRPLPL